MRERLSIRPYARLITMLGEQLIKNGIIALSELVKNSYDADASWVRISFVGFGEDYSITPESRIIIEDDGNGMDVQILKKHWLNPATPEKLKRKRTQPRTQLGRVLQGEKGIGRFAVFKLGKNITITTRRQSQDADGVFLEKGDGCECVLRYDFSKYDNEFLAENGLEKELFLDDLSVTLETRAPSAIVEKDLMFGSNKKRREPHGTIIDIGDLKPDWTETKVKRLQDEIGKLQPIFSEENNQDFSVWIFKDGCLGDNLSSYKEKLNDILRNKAVLKVTKGAFDVKARQFSFDLNDVHRILGFENQELRGLNTFRALDDIDKGKRDLECGSFEFEFYIFDFNADSETYSKYHLDSDEAKLVKDHRIYLYRDSLRVLPYGDPSDDWLRIDIARGTQRAMEYLSNDQVVGCVYITQKGNPSLKDKTSREGLMDEGNALDDFINLLRLLLRHLRARPFAQYLIGKKKKAELDNLKNGRLPELFKTAKEQFKEDKRAFEKFSSLERVYSKEKSLYEDRIHRTENLAAVGLSIETASHDLMLFLQRALDGLDGLLLQLSSGGEIQKEALQDKLTLVKGNLSIVKSQMKDIQLLFPSTKSKTKNIKVAEIVQKVGKFYEHTFNKCGIKVEYSFSKLPLVVKTTDAVLLQVFINLFDNAFYWLRTVDRERKILVTIDSDARKLVFSDNGPGILDEDINYIFEPFYSGKGEEGRGLGLYIARQLLDRYDYTIGLAEFSCDKLLPGANFVLEFTKGDQ